MSTFLNSWCFRLYSLILFCITGYILPVQAQLCLTPYYIDEPGVPPDFAKGASIYRYYNDTLMMNICNSGFDIRNIYVRERFFIQFNAHPDLVPTSIRQSDTTVDFSWQQLSTEYPEDRASMQAIEQRFGNYHLRFYPNLPENMPQDHYQIIFEEYTNLDSLQQLFHLSQEISLLTDFFVITDIPNDRSLIPGTSLEEIYLNGDADHRSSYYYQHGFQYNHYLIKTPMAWEITHGTSSTIIASVDPEWGSLPIIDNHPDIQRWNPVTNTNGNFIVVTSGTAGGGITTTDLRFGHGLRTLSTAIAKGNNDDGSSGAVAGVAWGVRGVGINTFYKASQINLASAQSTSA